MIATPVRGSKGGLLPLTILAAGALAALIALGVWQLQRGAQKQALLDQIRVRSTGTPEPLPARSEWPRLCVSEQSPVCLGTPAEFQRIVLEGSFLGARAAPVRATLPAPRTARELGGLGFWWFAAFELSTGGTVLVNRGFVPAEANGRPPTITMPEGPQRLVGWLRRGERRDLFAPADDPARGEIFTRDPVVIGRALGLSEHAPFLIDQERAEDAATMPVGVQADALITRIPNNHTAYALTWFGLAATLVGVYGAFVFARGRKDDTTAP